MSRSDCSKPRQLTQIRPSGVGLALALLFIWTIPSAAAQTILASGQTHFITPAETECVTITTIEPDIAISPHADAECDEATGTADVTAGDGGSLLAVEAVATAIFQFRFSVEAVDGAGGQSLLPIHVRVPNDWAFFLENTHLTELVGSASATILLQLRQDPDPDPEVRGNLVERTTILGATHGGTAGCLFLPGDPKGMTVLVAKCIAAAIDELRGSSKSSLSAIVKVGRTYTLELEITARVGSAAGFLNATALATTEVLLPPAPGLEWNEIVVTIGTDPAALVADLQEQIDELREDLETHTHNYLTGRGRGHNNTLAISSPAIIPGDSADGITAAELEAGPAKQVKEKQRKKRRTNYRTGSRGRAGFR